MRVIHLDSSGGGSSEQLVSRTIYVDPAGSDDRTDLDDHDQHAPWASVNAAHAVAVAGDLIKLSPGEHTLTAPFTLTAGVTIEGAGDETILLPSGTSSQITLSEGSEVRRLSCPTPNSSASGMFVPANGARARVSDITFASTPGNGYGVFANVANGHIVCERCRHISGGTRAVFGTSISSGRLDLVDCELDGDSGASAAVAGIWSDTNGGNIFVDRVTISEGYSSPRGVYLQGSPSGLFGRRLVNRSTSIQDALVLGHSGVEVDIDGFESEVSSSEDITMGALTGSANFRLTNARINVITAPDSYLEKISYAEDIRADVQAHASADITTASATPVLMTGMQLTTPARGVYRVHASVELDHSTLSGSITIGLYVGGSLYQAGSVDVQRTVQTGDGDAGVAPRREVTLPAVRVTLDGTETVELRWSTTGGTATAGYRSLILAPV